MQSKQKTRDLPNKSEETNQKPAGGFLIAHFKRYLGRYASEITGARAEHPLVICCCAPDNKREERATIHENKFSKMAVTHPRPRYIQKATLSGILNMPIYESKSVNLN